MRQRSNKRRAKARQASKLAEIRAALVAAGFDTIAKQSAVLGVGRSSTWAVLNSDKRAGPSANVIKRILSSPTLPPAARQKIEEYVEEKIRGLYGIASDGSRHFGVHFVHLTYNEDASSICQDRPVPAHVRLPVSVGFYAECERCPLWVISGHFAMRERDVRFTLESGHWISRPERTCAVQTRMSALCQ